MSITIKEIAELAGVSRGTVDRVIHNRGSVKPEIKEKVEEIIQKYHYESNRYAQALVANNKEFLVGVIINSIGNEFFDSILEGLLYQKNTYKNIKLLIKEYKGYDEEIQIAAIDYMVSKGVQALIITPINTPRLIRYLNEVNVPIVTLNNDIDIKKLGFVGCDYYNNGQMSGDIANIALPNGGHVATLVGSFKLRGHIERINGFKSVFKHAGSKVSLYEHQDDDDIAYELVKNILKNEKIDLIYFAAAGIAGGLRAIDEMGVKVPVITVDEIKIVQDALRQRKVLATITQQPYKQGSRAIQMVHDYLVYNSKPEKIENITSNKVQLNHSTFVVEK